jgi:hypothetical protein
MVLRQLKKGETPGYQVNKPNNLHDQGMLNNLIND